MSDAAKPTRKAIDWEAVERDYRTGRYTDRELGKLYGCSHAAVQKRAKSGGWEKDLAGAVKLATQAKLAEHEIAKVASAAVAKQVAKQVASAIPATTEVVAALAEVNSQVVLRHRGDLRAVRDEVTALLGELCWQREHLADLEQLAIVVAGDDPAAANARLKVFSRVVGLSGRVTSIKTLAEALAKVIPLEREAFGIQEGQRDDDDLRQVSDDELMRKARGLLGRVGTV